MAERWRISRTRNRRKELRRVERRLRNTAQLGGAGAAKRPAPRRRYRFGRNRSRDGHFRQRPQGAQGDRENIDPRRTWGVRMHSWAFRLRQIHTAQCACRLRHTQFRRGPCRRRNRERPWTRPRHGVSAILAVSMEDGERQRCVRPQGCRPTVWRSRGSRQHVSRDGRIDACRQSLSGGIVRRHAAAGGNRPSACQLSACSSNGRTVRRARRPNQANDAGEFCSTFGANSAPRSCSSPTISTRRFSLPIASSS